MLLAVGYEREEKEANRGGDGCQGNDFGGPSVNFDFLGIAHTAPS